MHLQVKLIKKFNLGFSIIEVILVLAIFGILSIASTSVYSSFKSHENLEIAATGVVEAIRHAQANAQSGKGDSTWGTKVLSGSVVIFKGVSYDTRDIASDQSLNFSDGIVASGISEIIFAKMTGSTSNTGTTILTNSYGSKSISINEKGTLTY